MTPSQPIFDAIADPTRRAILALVARDPSPVERIAARFPISRPAISKHLRILHAAGAVRREPRGRMNFYRADPAALAEVREWIDALWADKLHALKRLAEGDS